MGSNRKLELTVKLVYIPSVRVILGSQFLLPLKTLAACLVSGFLKLGIEIPPAACSIFGEHLIHECSQHLHLSIWNPNRPFFVTGFSDSRMITQNRWETQACSSKSFNSLATSGSSQSSACDVSSSRGNSPSPMPSFNSITQSHLTFVVVPSN